MGSQRNGVNHVSMGMAGFDRNTGPIRGTDYPVYSDSLLDWYWTKGVQCVRLSFTWEAVQSNLGGSVPPERPGYSDYWSDLTNLLTRFLARNIYVILAPWQYNSASRDTDIVYNDAAFSDTDFAAFWGRFAAAINAYVAQDQRISFDLINEPHTHAESGYKAGDIGIGLDEWFACAQAAISSIRAAGAINTIFVPGMQYTNARSFTSNGSAPQWVMLRDPLNNIAATVHCYEGIGSNRTTVVRDAFVSLVAWARANDVKVQVGEIAIDAGGNGRDSWRGTFATARAQWADWNAFCRANDDVLIGWNWWANSEAGWWNAGDSSDGSHWGLTLDNGVSQTVYADLIESTL
jgi:Cellulase (glycosyl hydrolase family 5)